MEKVCKHCGKGFTITEMELGLYNKTNTVIRDVCSLCLTKQHFAFWSFGKFRKAISAFSGENMITILPESVNFPIYARDEWFSDNWDALSYGIDYNPDIPFFEQLKSLQSKVPRPHQLGTQSTDCEYCDDVWQSKNCWLTRSILECEDLSYGYRLYGVKNSIDATYCFSGEKYYDSTYCYNSYNLNYSRNCNGCIDSSFLYDCRNCTDCFMCYNISNQTNCILNQKYSKEEYDQKMKEINFGSYEEIQKLKSEFEEILKTKAIHRATTNINSKNSTGNYIKNCEKCLNAYQMEESKNVANTVRGMKQNDSIDLTGCWVLENSGNLCGCTDIYDVRYSILSDHVSFSEYLDYCHFCENCFGCVGLRKKKFCILNKEYSEEEYYKLRDKIIADMKERGEYGEFSPYNMGLGPYNLTTGMFYFPNTQKDEILKQGGYWEDLKEVVVDGMETKNLPDNIADVSDEICSQPLVCPVTGWRYNIAEHELEFYRQKNIPLPRVHFDVRTKERVKYLTVIEPFKNNCCFCKKEITTYYRPEWNYQKIACDECYLKEVM